MNSKTTPGAGEEKKILERRINVQGLKGCGWRILLRKSAFEQGKSQK